MAQFLNTRERRACLKALADLASGGARGVLTSRPNYFNESEELHVFEALYKQIDEHKYYVSREDKSYINEEMRIDALLGRYILDRYERILRDLSEEQTKALIVRKLSDDAEGQKLVLAILKSVFRTAPDGARQSLAGKPVIITYLLDLIAEIKDNKLDANGITLTEWTEWRIYKLIIDRLMFRDQQPTPGILPYIRRECLQQLAIKLTQRDFRAATDDIFYEIIDQQFRNELQSLDSGQKSMRRNELFENLRSSATLTRSEEKTSSGWVFSHNSLREYLVTEAYVSNMKHKHFINITVPISEAMRAFTASMGKDEIQQCIEALTAVWPERASKAFLGSYLTLLWDGIVALNIGKSPELDEVLKNIGGGVVSFDFINIHDVEICRSDVSNEHLVVLGRTGEFSRVGYKDMDLTGSDFGGAFLIPFPLLSVI